MVTLEPSGLKQQAGESFRLPWSDLRNYILGMADKSLSIYIVSKYKLREPAKIFLECSVTRFEIARVFWYKTRLFYLVRLGY